MRVFFALLLSAGVVTADLPPSPKPAGSKTLTGSHMVTLKPDVKGWVFVTSEVLVLSGKKGPPPIIYSRLELSETKAVDLANKRLHAIPAESAKAYPKDADLTEALRQGKLEGVRDYFFSAPTVEVRTGEKAERPISESVMTDIHEKDGIKVRIKGEGREKPEDKKKDKPISAEPGGWVGGIAAALAVTLGGLWLMRRKK